MPVRHLFDRILEVPAPVMRAWMIQEQDSPHPASTFAFLLDRDLPPQDVDGWARKHGLGDDDGATPEYLRLALATAARPQSVLIVLDRSQDGQDLICAVARGHVVATFFTPNQTCLLSLPLAVAGFSERLVEDLGRWRPGDEDPPLPGSPGLVLSGQKIPPERLPHANDDIRHAMFAGPPGNRWLVVPPPQPQGRIQLVRLADRDLELLVADLLHQKSIWGSFDDARTGWEASVSRMHGA